MKNLAVMIILSGVLVGASRCEREPATSDAGVSVAGATAGKGGAAAGKGGATAGKGTTGGKGSAADRKCGPNTCEGDEVCCNASCGICTKPGQGCTKQFCAPDDVDAGEVSDAGEPATGEPCGASVCGVGQECCNPSCGICVEPGGACTQQFCGDPGPSGPQCGGFAGRPCPGAGSCEDDPSDSCDPERGGADCGGLCACNAIGLCVDGSTWDSSPEVCGCVPKPDACASVRCRAGTECQVQDDGSAKCIASGPGCRRTGDKGSDDCPGLGDCIDDPTDNCDLTSDASCVGVCTCEAVPKCMADQIFDSNPSVCACTEQLTNPCAAILCPQNTRCEVKQVQCIRAPCPAQAVCVDL